MSDIRQIDLNEHDVCTLIRAQAEELGAFGRPDTARRMARIRELCEFYEKAAKERV